MAHRRFSVSFVSEHGVLGIKVAPSEEPELTTVQKTPEQTKGEKGELEVKGRQDGTVTSEDNTNEESKEALGKKGAKRKRNVGQATRQSPRTKAHEKEVEKKVDQEESEEEAVEKVPKKPRKQPKQKAVSNQVHQFLPHCLLFLVSYVPVFRRKETKAVDILQKRRLRFAHSNPA
jgi:hypothetical protein